MFPGNKAEESALFFFRGNGSINENAGILDSETLISSLGLALRMDMEEFGR